MKTVTVTFTAEQVRHLSALPCDPDASQEEGGLGHYLHALAMQDATRARTLRAWALEPDGDVVLRTELGEPIGFVRNEGAQWAWGFKDDRGFAGDEPTSRAAVEAVAVVHGYSRPKGG